MQKNLNAEMRSAWGARNLGGEEPRGSIPVPQRQYSIEMLVADPELDGSDCIVFRGWGALQDRTNSLLLLVVFAEMVFHMRSHLSLSGMLGV